MKKVLNTPHSDLVLFSTIVLQLTQATHAVQRIFHAPNTDREDQQLDNQHASFAVLY